jgi:hypothetical protein
MNYENIYNLIVSRAKIRPLLSFEIHHILPKSLGGDNSIENLVQLTHKEHILCHELLWKKYRKLVGINHESTRKMAHAFHFLMTDHNGLRFPSIRQAALALVAAREAQLGKKLSEDTKHKISLGHKGQIPWNKNMQGWASTETSEKISNANKGNKHALGIKLNESQLVRRSEINSGINNPMFGHSHSEKSRKAMSDSQKQLWTLERRKQYSNVALSRKKIMCNHCGKKATAGMFARWHGQNCKNYNADTND